MGVVIFTMEYLNRYPIGLGTRSGRWLDSVLASSKQQR